MRARLVSSSAIIALLFSATAGAEEAPPSREERVQQLEQAMKECNDDVQAAEEGYRRGRDQAALYAVYERCVSLRNEWEDLLYNPPGHTTGSGRRDGAPASPFSSSRQVVQLAADRLSQASDTGAGTSPQIAVRDDIDPGAVIDSSDRFASTVFILTPSGACTGTVINARQVLTAAHCFDGATTGARVAVGRDAADPDRIINAVAVAVHEDWPMGDPGGAVIGDNAAIGDDDVAVITLETPLTTVDPVTLDTRNGDALRDAVGDEIVVTGYGMIGDGNTLQPADGLRRYARNTLDAAAPAQVVLDFLPEGLANLGETTALFYDFDAPGGPPPEEGGPVDLEGISASGDSGGPVFYEDEEGRLIQIGVTSGSLGLSGPRNGYGGISFATAVAPYRDWIDAASPYVDVSWGGGDGLWSDAANWSTGTAPQNQTGPFQLLSGPGSPDIYRVTLDAAGRTRLAGQRLVDGVYVNHPDAVLQIDQGARLVALEEVVLSAGEINLDGELLSSRMLIEDGGFTVSKTGVYRDGSSVFDGGIFLTGGALAIDGAVITDAFDIYGGAVEVSASGYVFDRDGTILDGGSLAMNGYLDTGFLDVLSGQFALGADGVVYDASGLTVVAGGESVLDGFLDTRLVAQSGGRVSGSGTILAPEGYVHLAGELSPGGSQFRNLLIAGDYLAGPDATVRLLADANGITQLLVTGDVLLDGATIAIDRDPDWTPRRGGRLPVILSASTLSASDLTLDAAPLSATLSFALEAEADALFAEIEAAAFTDFADDRYSRAPAEALDRALAPFGGDLPDGDLGALVGALDAIARPADLSETLARMSPQETYLTDTTGFEFARMLTDAASARSRYASDDAAAAEVRSLALIGSSTDASRYGGFVQGGWFSAEASVGERTARVRGEFAFAGADARLTSGVVIGGGVASMEGDSRGRGFDFDARSEAVLGFAAYSGERLHFSASAGYAWLDPSGGRRLPSVGPAVTARWSGQAEMAFSSFETGLRFGSGAVRFGPVARVSYANISIDAYRDTPQSGGDFATALAARDTRMTLLETGAEVILGVDEVQDGLRQPTLFLRALHVADLSPDPDAASAAFLAAPQATVFNPPVPVRDETWATIKGGASIPFSAVWSGELGLSADLGREMGQSTGARFTLAARF